MNALILMIATTAVSVEAGWLPLSDGGVEYIIQIEPNALDTLLRQSDVESEIPPNLDVRRVRITVGTSKLPRQSAPNSPNPNAAGAAPGGLNVSPKTNSPTSSNAAPGDGVIPLNSLANAAPPIPTTLGSAPGSGGSVSPPPLTNVPPSGFSGNNLGNSTTPPTTPPLASDAGPELGAPASSFADSQRAMVAQVLDDPRAPGKNPYLAVEQPQLPAGAGVGRRDLLAESHATQRPSDGRGAEQGFGNGQNMSQNAGTGGANYNPPANNYGQQRQYNPNERFAGDGSGQAATHVDATHHTQVANVPEPQERPWPALLFTVTLLLMSLSLNVYLGWVAWDSRQRYQELLTQHDPLAVGV